MISTDEALLGFAILGSAVGPCPHRQAEPVRLMTGETVACICISCLRQLPSGWIAWQRERAETIAWCAHPERIELRELGQAQADWICAVCGAEPE